MEIRIYRTPSELDKAAAAELLRPVQNMPDAVIGLSTGRTTGSIHRAFCELAKLQKADLSRVTFFGVDEVSGVPREYSGACYTMLRNEVIAPLGIREDQFIMLPTLSDDFPTACRAFTEELGRRGGIELLFLGLGENGHLGFNQPGTPFDSTAWHSVMYPELEERIRRETCSPPDKHLGGVTLGLKDIMHARHTIVAAKGYGKAAIVKKMIQGPVTEEVPASVLQLHPSCLVLLDAEAASQL